MKKVLITLSASMLMVFGLTASASNFRVGIIDTHKILTSSPQAQQVKAKLQKEFQPKEAALQKQQDTLKADAEKLRKESTILSSADREALQKKVMSGQRSLQENAMKLRQEESQAQNDAYQDLLGKVKTYSQNIAKKQKLNVVIDRQVALYFENQLDITDQVMKALGSTNS